MQMNAIVLMRYCIFHVFNIYKKMDIFQKMKDYLPKGVRISKIVGLQNTEYFMSKAVRVSSLYQNIDITRWNGMSVIRKQCIPNIKTILQLICPNDWQNHFETGSSKCTLDSITKRQLQDVYRKLMISKHNLKKPFVFLWKEEDISAKLMRFSLSLTEDDSIEGNLTLDGEQKVKEFVKELVRNIHFDLVCAKEDMDSEHLQAIVRKMRLEKAANSYK